VPPAGGIISRVVSKFCKAQQAPAEKPLVCLCRCSGRPQDCGHHLWQDFVCRTACHPNLSEAIHRIL
jgi:hypothetical protein